MYLNASCMYINFTSTFSTDEEIKWSIGEIRSTVDGATSYPVFVANPIGPTSRTKEAKTSLQVLQLLLTTVILQSIVQQTQLYAEQKDLSFSFASRN